MTMQRSGIQVFVQDDGSLDKVANKADKADKSLDGVVDSANRAEQALQGISGNIDITIGVNAQEVYGIQDDILALDDLTPIVTIGTEDSELVTTRSTLDDLDTFIATIPVNVDDTEIGQAQTAVQNLDDMTPDIPVNVDDKDADKDLQDIKSKLETLQQLAVIDIAMNLPANLGNIGSKIPGLGGIVDMDNAVRTLGITTDEVIENGEQLITDIYLKGFAESREEIARMIGTLANLGIAEDQIGGVATNLFETQNAIQGISGETVGLEDLLKRMQSLQELGLASDFEDAGNIITAGFQSAIGISGDFLGDLGEFAPTFATLGFTSQQMLNTLDTGLAGGVDNISRMSEGLISFNEAATQAPENVRQTLAELDKISGTDLIGELDLFQAGQMTGADFMASVLDSARAYASTEGLPAVQGILGNLFGGTASNIGAQALLNINPNADEFTNLENRAQEASDEMQKSFESMFNQIGRMGDDAARRLFSSDAVDLDGKLQTFRGQFDTFLTELESGGTIADAINVAFELDPGTFQRIESVFNNIAISFMQTFQSVLSVLGKSDEAAALGREIGRLATGQLQFDLGALNTDELPASIATAVSRTGDWTPVIGAVQGAVDEALAGGDFGQAFDIVGAAREALAAEGQHSELDVIFEQMGVRMADQLRPAFDQAMGEGDLLTADTIAQGMGDLDMQLLVNEFRSSLQASFESAMSTGDFDMAGLIASQMGDNQMGIQAAFEKAMGAGSLADAVSQMGLAEDPAVQESMRVQTDALAAQLTSSFESAIQSGDFDMAATLAEQIGDATLVEQVKGLAGALGDTTVAAQTSNIETSAALADTQKSVEDYTASSGEQLDINVQKFIEWESKASQSLDNVSGKVDLLAGKLGALNAATAAAGTDPAMMPSIAGNPYAGGGGGNSTTNINLNNSVTTQNTAQADAFGYRTSRQIRGFS